MENPLEECSDRIQAGTLKNTRNIIIIIFIWFHTQHNISTIDIDALGFLLGSSITSFWLQMDIDIISLYFLFVFVCYFSRIVMILRNFDVGILSFVMTDCPWPMAEATCKLEACKV